MHSAIILIPIILISAFLEINFPQFLKLFGTTPNLLLIAVVFFNMHFKQKNALALSGFCGVVKDIFSIARFGTNIISFVICGFAANKLKTSVYHQERVFQALLVFLISLANSFVIYLLNLTSINLSFFRYLFFVMLPEGFYTAVLSLLIFRGLKICVSKFSIQ